MVCKEAICFGDGDGDAFIYGYLSLFVVFFCFFDLELEHFLPVFFCFPCMVLLYSLASFLLFCFCGVLSLVVFPLRQDGDLVVQVILGVDFFFLEVPVWPLESFFDCLIWFCTSDLISSFAIVSACLRMSSWSCSW